MDDRTIGLAIGVFVTNLFVWWYLRGFRHGVAVGTLAAVIVVALMWLCLPERKSIVDELIEIQKQQKLQGDL